MIHLILIIKLIKPKLTKKEFKSWHNGNFYKTSKVNNKHINNFFKIQYTQYLSLKTDRKIKKGLLNLKKEYDLFIISSCSEKILNTYFKNNNIKNIFNKVLGYETHKTKEHKFKFILIKYELRKKECIFVTGTLGDILEANKAGIKTIAVDFGYHDKKLLKKGNPLKIISNFNEISEIIKKLN